MQGYFVRTKEGYIGMIKDVVSAKEYSGDNIVNEKTILYLYDDINGKDTFYSDEVEIIENLFHI